MGARPVQSGAWWVPEELNLSTPAALFHSRPGYSRLSGKGPVLVVRVERTLKRGLSSPPLPLGYARGWRTVEGSNLRTLAGSAR